MNKKLLMAAVALLAAGAVLLGVGAVIDRGRGGASGLGAVPGKEQAGEDRETAPPGDSAASDAALSGENAAQLELGPFSQADLSVVAADIRFEEGESYGLRYRLHPDEAVVRAEVEGEALRFSTKTREGASISGDWEVVVTIPRDARLADLSAVTVSGDISLSGRAMDTLRLATTSGDIAAAAVTAHEVQAASTSGAIAITDLSTHSVNAASTSGNVSLTGTADSLELAATSGACAFSGELTGSGSVGTVSGNIDVAVPGAGAEANSLGEITWNGRSQGRSLYIPGDGPFLTLGSVSGDIRVTTE